MFIFSFKRLWYLIFAVIAIAGLQIFYNHLGFSMLVLLIVGLLALKFLPAAVIPILIVSLFVYLNNGFSFVVDIIQFIFIGLPFSIVMAGFLFPFVESCQSKLRKRKKEYK
ncbi:TPA: hypothetical protein ACJR7G_000777 [Streptococcus agalactiae]